MKFKHSNQVGSRLLMLALLGFLVLPRAGLGKEADFRGAEGVGLQNPRQVLPSKLVHFTTSTEPREVHPGEHFRVLVTVNIVRGWHIYSLIPSESRFAPPPSKLIVSDTSMRVLGEAYETNPLLEEDPAFAIPLALHKNTARFYQNFQVPQDVPSYGPTSIPLRINWQVCSDEYCTRPISRELLAIVNLSAGEVRPAQAYMERSVDLIDKQGRLHASPDNMQAILFSGVWKFLLLAASFGLFALLTPCVFPLIPITVSFFLRSDGVESENPTRVRLKLVLVFGLGIVFSITSLGFGATVLFGATGILRFASHPLVNLVIGCLFILFGFSLLGLFNFSLPNNFINRFVRWSQNIKGTGGIILMGMAFAITSFTCTAPFVGTLLLAATQGQTFWPLIGMLTYSAVFALPFVLISMSPRLLGLMQGKGGAWMTLFKSILGLVELMAALKFISNADLIWGWGLLTRSNLLIMWSVLTGIAVVILIGFPPLPFIGRHLSLSKLRLLFAAGFAGLAAYFVLGANGYILNSYVEAYLPPFDNSASLATKINPDRKQARQFRSINQLSSHNLPWNETLALALQQARRQKKPVFVDFTGYTCINCRWMEARIFSHPEIHQTFKEKFALAKLYTDGGPYQIPNQELQLQRFQTIALPYYVILSPDNTILWRHAGVVSTPAEFLQMLNQTLKTNAAYLR